MMFGGLGWGRRRETKWIRLASHFLKGIEFYIYLRDINKEKCMLHTMYVWFRPKLDEGMFGIIEASICIVTKQKKTQANSEMCKGISESWNKCGNLRLVFWGLSVEWHWRGRDWKRRSGSFNRQSCARGDARFSGPENKTRYDSQHNVRVYKSRMNFLISNWRKK